MHFTLMYIFVLRDLSKTILIIAHVIISYIINNWCGISFDLVYFFYIEGVINLINNSVNSYTSRIYRYFFGNARCANVCYANVCYANVWDTHTSIAKDLGKTIYNRTRKISPIGIFKYMRGHSEVERNGKKLVSKKNSLYIWFILYYYIREALYNYF